MSPLSERQAWLPIVVAALVGLLTACGSGVPAAPMAAPATVSPPRPSARPTPSPTIPVEFCERLDEVRAELTQLLAVERRVANRRVLDEALTELEAAFDDLVQAERGPADDALERPMRELGYRMIDVTLGIEDYRTTTRPAEAAEHIARAGSDFTVTLDGVSSLAGCRS